MARRTMQDLLRSSVKDATSLGAEHRKIVESLGKQPAQELGVNQEVQPEGATEWCNQKIQPDKLRGTTSRLMQLHQKVQPDGTTVGYNLEEQPDEEPNLVKARPRDLTPIQKRILDHLKQRGPHITDKSIVSQSLGIPPLTVRNTLVRLTELGLVSRRRVGQGVRVEVIGAAGLCTTERCNHMVQPSGTTLSPSKIDRENSLSISQERVKLTWPKLAAAGFGSHQIEQIQDALAELGKPADRIVQSLDHAEWELEQGKMLDKDGRPVADPCSWIFRSLARTGYYRRPAGYVSPEEQAAMDEEAQAKAVMAAREKAEHARFDVWKSGLSEEEMAMAMAGHPGGPKDAWLRRIWKERQAPE